MDKYPLCHRLVVRSLPMSVAYLAKSRIKKIPLFLDARLSIEAVFIMGFAVSFNNLKEVN